MKTTDKVGKMVTIKEVIDKDDLMIITNQGVLIRQPVAQIRAIGRATQGVKLIKLGEGTLVSSITRIMTEEESEEERASQEGDNENNNPKTEEATN
jgi:DNA gyrase subunit A